jgi:hypothetical protein
MAAKEEGLVETAQRLGEEFRGRRGFNGIGHLMLSTAAGEQR